MDVAVAGASDRRLEAVRGWWRVRHPPPTLGRRLDVAYTAAITVAILGAVAYGTAGSALAEVLTPARLEAFGPAAALVGLVLIARWGAYQGPVVFTVADVAFLLGASLPRRGLAATPRARAGHRHGGRNRARCGADRRPRRGGARHRGRRRRRAHRGRRRAGRPRRRGRLGGRALGSLGADGVVGNLAHDRGGRHPRRMGSLGHVVRCAGGPHGRDGAGDRGRAARLRALSGGAPSPPRRGTPERRRVAGGIRLAHGTALPRGDRAAFRFEPWRPAATPAPARRAVARRGLRRPRARTRRRGRIAGGGRRCRIRPAGGPAARGRSGHAGRLRGSRAHAVAAARRARRARPDARAAASADRPDHPRAHARARRRHGRRGRAGSRRRGPGRRGIRPDRARGGRARTAAHALRRDVGAQRRTPPAEPPRNRHGGRPHRRRLHGAHLDRLVARDDRRARHRAGAPCRERRRRAPLAWIAVAAGVLAWLGHREPPGT